MACAISSNSKTGFSVDCTTDCPKRRTGKACKYCYVEASRNARFNAKIVTETCVYSREILRFSAAKIAKLNESGGIRMFSFGDYMPEHRETIRQILDDCFTMGLTVKVITKVPEFIEEFHSHPAIRRIHVSVDNVGDGVDWKQAKQLRKRYSKVLIRSAIMRDDDVKVLQFADIHTFNHARGLARLGYRKFSHEKVLQYAETLPGKVCCTTGSCFSCPVKCGL